MYANEKFYAFQNSKLSIFLILLTADHDFLVEISYPHTPNSGVKHLLPRFTAIEATPVSFHIYLPYASIFRSIYYNYYY